MARNRDVAPAIPFIYVHHTFSFAVSDTPTPITWEHIHFITPDFSITSGDTRIRVRRGVATSGVYMLYVSAGAIKKAGNPVQIIIEIYINGVLCECAAAHGSIGAGVEHSDATLITAIYLNVGDYLEVYVSVDAGSATIEDDTARWIISALPMQGWDNERGGKNRIRGGVSR